MEIEITKTPFEGKYEGNWKVVHTFGLIENSKFFEPNSLEWLVASSKLESFKITCKCKHECECSFLSNRANLNTFDNEDRHRHRHRHKTRFQNKLREKSDSYIV